MIHLSGEQILDTVKAMVDAKLRVILTGYGENLHLSKMPLKKSDKVYLVSVFSNEKGVPDIHYRLDGDGFMKAVNVALESGDDYCIETY